MVKSKMRWQMQWLSAIAVLALTLALGALKPATPAPIQAQAQAVGRSFPETGHTVSGKFLAYWNAHGGLPQQGYPISDEFTEVSDTDGKPYTVQYFERAVFEAHPDNAAPNDVLLSLLGNFLYKQKYPGGAANQTSNTTPGSTMFTQTGHRVRGKFLTYWQSHGGLAQQGYPISDEFSEVSALNGKTYTVQYFERAVFEAHPENAPPYDVLLSQLGTFRFKQKYPNGVPLADGIPENAVKPAPPLNTFHGCPSAGDGGDPVLNIHKNRTDTAPWYPVSYRAIAGLTWPQAIGQKFRSSWSASDAAQVAKYEGIPVRVEGYLAAAKQEGPETANCHSVSDEDYHVWLVDNPAKGKGQSVVTEITPRVRALHPRWSIGYLMPLAQSHVKVRLSGWLMMDQEHPEQIGQYRATLWEVHPIMGFDVWQNGAWTPLDSGTAPPPLGPQAATTTAPPPPAPSPPPGGYYEASATVSNPNPGQNSNVTVTGRLTRGGQGVAGVAMDTTWHYKTTTSGCSGVTDANGIASCTRDISRATAGYTVVIEVTFRPPDGAVVTAETSFTPH